MSFRRSDHEESDAELDAYVCGTATGCRGANDHAPHCVPPRRCPDCGRRSCYQDLLRLLNSSCSPQLLQEHLDTCTARTRARTR